MIFELSLLRDLFSEQKCQQLQGEFKGSFKGCNCREERAPVLRFASLAQD